MVSTKKSLLLVIAPEASAIPAPAYKEIIYIADESRIFPAIHELQPVAIMLDYDYLGCHTEKILRRLAVNPFYQKIKIYCYKPTPHTNVDSLLTVLGVHQFIYAKDTQQLKQKNSAIKTLGLILRAILSHKLVDTGY